MTAASHQPGAASGRRVSAPAACLCRRIRPSRDRVPSAFVHRPAARAHAPLLSARSVASVMSAPATPCDSPGKNTSGLPFPPPGDLPNPAIEPSSPALTGGFFTPTEPRGKPQRDVINYTKFSRCCFISDTSEVFRD